jgi:signal transduction histidine kinase
LITHFAPPERKGIHCVLSEATVFQDTPLSKMLLNSGLNAILVLNSCRQIVTASENVLALCVGKTLEDLLGKRPGEALGCIHAYDCESGCGTSEFCRECGAVKAILGGLSGTRCSEECRLTRMVAGQEQSLDLQVLATPLDVKGERFTLFAITDISHEKRRRALERIFFHDIINLAGGAEGLLANIMETAPADISEDVALSYNTVREIVEEIISQRDLAAAERAELIVTPVLINSERLLREISALYQNHHALQGRRIVFAQDSAVIDFVSDVTLVRRILGNLIKNAAEAAKIGQQITVGCRVADARIEFSVQNPQVMSPEVQHQVFQRSFSTKGTGRGLGTYSVKLIAERSLKGLISFSSTEPAGTTFTLSLPLMFN